jgi:tight adherence protein C
MANPKPSPFLPSMANSTSAARAGFVVAVLVTFGLPAVAGRSVSAAAVVGGTIIGVLGGILGRDGWLGRQVARRQDRILRELPTLADLLCLAVTAGEGPRAALERTSSGPAAS